jgi:hypothetical protein
MKKSAAHGALLNGSGRGIWAFMPSCSGVVVGKANYAADSEGSIGLVFGPKIPRLGRRTWKKVARLIRLLD